MSVLKDANSLFLSGNYQEALDLYTFFQRENSALSKFVEFNVNYCVKKIQSPSKFELPSTVVKKNQPSVSVIIPCHNVESYIERCIESVLGQSLTDIEIIVIDDGSTDNTLNILNRYSKLDTRLKLIINSKPSGNSGTPRNQALCIAKGKYISFVDADDYIDADMLKTLFDKAQIEDADICSAGGFYRETSDGQTIETNVTHRYYDPYNGQPERNELFKSIHFTIVWFRIYRNDFIQENGIRFGEFKTSADSPFAFKALMLANKLVSVEEKFYHYQFDRPGSTVDRRKGLGAFEMYLAYQSVIDFINLKGLQDKFLPIVMNKVIGDFNYNSRFIKEDLSAYFKDVAACFIGRYYNSINDFSIFSDYTKKLMSTLYEHSISCKKDHYQDFFNHRYEKQPCVSVIVPAHNVEKFIDNCITSITQQTLSNIEIIIIDDGSTDSTGVLIDKLAIRDNRIVVIKNKFASGNPGTPRNVGMAYSSGKYLGFVDSDDWINYDFFEKLFEASADQSCDIVTSDSFIRYEDEVPKLIKLNARNFDIEKAMDRLQLYKQNYFSNIWYRIYNANFIKSNSITIPSIYLSEDFCFSFVTHALANKVNIAKDAIYNYRYERIGSTTDYRRSIKSFEQIHSFIEAKNHVKRFIKSKELIDVFSQKKFFSFIYTYGKLCNSLKDEFKKEVVSLFSKELSSGLSLSFLSETQKNEFNDFMGKI